MTAETPACARIPLPLTARPVCATVQVLHSGDRWFGGMIVEEGHERGRWRILFDDGESDWYILPHRCAALPSHPRSGLPLLPARGV